MAVLGFQNLSGDPKQAWISTALSEMLGTELAAGQRLRLVPPEDVSRAQHEVQWQATGMLGSQTLAKIRRNLDCDLVVLGSYAVLGQAGDQRLRVDARVQDASTGDVLAEFAETGGAADFFELVSRTGARLRQAIGLPNMSPTEMMTAQASVPSDNVATQFYSQGLARLRVFDTLAARDLFQNAITIEPDYPLAHAALAESWAQLGYEQRAAGEAAKAFQLSEHLSSPERMAIEGQLHTTKREWQQAIAVYRSLYEMYPDNVEYGLRFARAQISGARPRDALQTLNTLRDIQSGKDPRIELEIASAWNKLGDFRQLSEALSRAAEQAQTSGAQLLLAQARRQQCWASQYIAKPQEGLPYCREAQRIYAAAGDRGAEANTLRTIGDVLSSSGQPGAIGLFKQALAIDQDIGDLSGEAIVLNEMAIQYSAQGKHRTAQQLFEQTLQIFERTDNQVDRGGVFINIGVELAAQDDLAGAQRRYRQALESARQIGNKEMEAIALISVGQMQQSKGDLKLAKQSLQNALALFNEVNDQAGASDCKFNMGEIATAQGDFVTARKLLEESLMARKSAKRETAIAESELALAELALNQNEVAPQVESSVRHAMDVFAKNQAPEDEARAHALLARILLVKNKPDDARREADAAIALVEKAQHGVRLSVESQIAPVWAVTTPPSGLHDLERRMTMAINEAHKLGYAEAELRLAESLRRARPPTLAPLLPEQQSFSASRRCR